MVFERNFVQRNVFSLLGDWMKFVSEIFLSKDVCVFLPQDVAYNPFGLGVS